MGLKNILDVYKSDGFVTRKLDQYLLTLEEKDNDRRWDINSPSMASKCPREIYYSRIGEERDAGNTDSRSRRILDNGTHFHIRMQEYLKDIGVLLMDEVPVFHVGLKIQGHTDGILRISKDELGVLELKSINSNNYSKLKDAKEDHKYQGQTYMLCLETLRKKLRRMYKTKAEFSRYLKANSTHERYAGMYEHLKDGSKYSREEKIEFKVRQHLELDKLLWNTPKPIKSCFFVYENKDTQELKEFCVEWNDDIVDDLSSKFTYINSCVVHRNIPDRGAKSKGDLICRWCPFRGTCFIL